LLISEGARGILSVAGDAIFAVSNMDEVLARDLEPGPADGTHS